VPVENFEHLGLARGLVAERFPGLVAAEIGLTGLHRCTGYAGWLRPGDTTFVLLTGWLAGMVA
jgi:hypothetical protein